MPNTDVTIPTLCDEMKRLSIETWERIGFARSRSGLKIYETTITQNLLFGLKKFSEHYGTGCVQMFEATNEATNGNDMEIFLQVGSNYICLPAQAKIIYADEKYPRMEHGDQIKHLMKYAKSIGGYPLYLLYNYVTESKLSPEDCGCSIVSAQYLCDNYAHKSKKKKWIIPKFTDLHPNIAEPWHILACDVISKVNELFIVSWNLTLIPKDFESIKEYTFEEILHNPDWKQLSLVPQEQSHDGRIEKKKIIDGYAPRFRVVISNPCHEDTE